MGRVCRFCGNPLTETFVDLGLSPLSNAFMNEDKLNRVSKHYPLHTYVCGKCFLVQLEEFESPVEIFTDYLYFSSYSESWVRHAQSYTNHIVETFGCDEHSQVVEIACNDGYLLQFFVERNIPVLGIEPAKNVAEEAKKKGIPVVSDFFGLELAEQLKAQGKSADLLIGNNVLAHVPNLNDFVAGMKVLLSEHGVITMEFPHLLKLMQENQYDTIYHEHFSYLSFHTVQQIFRKHGLAIFDVMELLTHGGSLRIYVKHEHDGSKQTTERVKQMESMEAREGLHSIISYRAFSEQVRSSKRNILKFVIEQKNSGKRIAGYGAPAKANTLLNYCGIGKDMIDYVVDRNPFKQGLYLPGTQIPVYAPEKIRETKPDFLVIMPWNLKDEIMQQMSYIEEWGGQFVLWIPDVKVLKAGAKP